MLKWAKRIGLALDYIKFSRRLILFCYAAYVWVMTNRFYDIESPTMEQAIVMSTIVGLSAAVFGFYTNSPAEYAKLGQAQTRLRQMDGEDDADEAEEGFWEDTKPPRRNR